MRDSIVDWLIWYAIKESERSQEAKWMWPSDSLKIQITKKKPLVEYLRAELTNLPSARTDPILTDSPSRLHASIYQSHYEKARRCHPRGERISVTFYKRIKKKCVFVHLHHLNHGLMSTCSNTHTHTLFFSISKYFNIAYLLNSSISLSCVFAIFVSLLHSSSWSAWEHSPTRPFVLHTNCPRLESETVSLCVKKKIAH